MKLANAAVTIIANGWTVQDFLAYFGRCFIRAAGTFGYEKLIKVSRNFFYFRLLCVGLQFVPFCAVPRTHQIGSGCLSGLAGPFQ
jgi:hypothetical protein